MSLADKYPFYLANEPHFPNTDLEVKDKYTGEVATRVAVASPDDIDRAMDTTVEATEPASMGRVRSGRRGDWGRSFLAC
jgi:acyl-CoA reductase-like NAD-dependent aldehyde dehydrogenase